MRREGAGGGERRRRALRGCGGVCARRGGAFPSCPFPDLEQMSIFEHSRWISSVIAETNGVIRQGVEAGGVRDGTARCRCG